MKKWLSLFFMVVLLLGISSYAYAKENSVSVDIENSPFYGKADAPVTIVEFTDFECHFCGRVQPALKKVLETYPNEVKLVFKNFPLSFHQHAREAHLAAMCAEESGKFWDYRNMLFSHQQALKREDLISYAKELGLKETSFAQCLDSEKYGSKVEKDFQDGVEVGVMGTPTFFINGKRTSGAIPFEEFDQLVKKALEKKS